MADHPLCLRPPSTRKHKRPGLGPMNTNLGAEPQLRQFPFPCPGLEGASPRIPQSPGCHKGSKATRVPRG